MIELIKVVFDFCILGQGWIVPIGMSVISGRNLFLSTTTFKTAISYYYEFGFPGNQEG